MTGLRPLVPPPLTEPDANSPTRHGEIDTDVKPWPVLDKAGWHGPAGRYAQEAAPFTEADPVAVLVSLLLGAGAVIGSGPHVRAGNDRHPCALFAVIVGQTSRAGKGTAFAAARAPLLHLDPSFFGDGSAGRVLGGFNSGEAVVDALGDGEGDDPGTKDKRLFVYEPEFARLLKAAARDGSTLSMLLRDGWDGRRLETRARSKVTTARGYHLVALGHVTAEELRARLTDTETYGGFANRFLWVCVRRAGRLPEGGNVPDDLAEHWGHQLSSAVRDARRHTVMKRTPAAVERWREVYDEMGDDDPGGLLGAVIARAEPITLRLSLLYALLDRSPDIDVPHVDAAYAVWRYARDSAAYVFGDVIGDATADRLLEALRRAGDDGLDREAQHKALGGHKSAAALDNAARLLVTRGLAIRTVEATDGRPREVLRAAKKAKYAKKGVDAGHHGSALSNGHDPDADGSSIQGSSTDGSSADGSSTDGSSTQATPIGGSSTEETCVEATSPQGTSTQATSTSSPRPNLTVATAPSTGTYTWSMVGPSGPLRDLPVFRTEACRRCKATTIYEDDYGTICRACWGETAERHGDRTRARADA